MTSSSSKTTIFLLTTAIQVHSLLFNNRLLWKQSITYFQDVYLSFDNLNPTEINRVDLPSGKSFTLSSTTCNGTKVNFNEYLNLVLLYSPNSPSIIVCKSPSIQLIFSSPISSFGFDMEPISFGQFLMEVILSDGTSLLQKATLFDESKSIPTFFGFSKTTQLITSLTLKSLNSSSFAITNIIEGFDHKPSPTPSFIPYSSKYPTTRPYCGSTLAPSSCSPNFSISLSSNDKNFSQSTVIGITISVLVSVVIILIIGSYFVYKRVLTRRNQSSASGNVGNDVELYGEHDSGSYHHDQNSPFYSSPLPTDRPLLSSERTL